MCGREKRVTQGSANYTQNKPMLKRLMAIRIIRTQATIQKKTL